MFRFNNLFSRNQISFDSEFILWLAEIIEIFMVNLRKHTKYTIINISYFIFKDNQNYGSNRIIKPDDWHVHFRDGEMLKAVVPETTRHFSVQ